MKRMLWVLALTIVSSAFTQQQPPTGPPYTTPPTFPTDKTSRQEMPPDTKAPAPTDSLSTAQVQRQIQEKLSTEPALANTNVGVKATGKAVTLTGSVDTEQQHDLALRIAQSYAGDRKIVDKIKVRGQGSLQTPGNDSSLSSSSLTCQHGDERACRPADARGQ